jgi:hypothetical protein
MLKQLKTVTGIAFAVLLLVTAGCGGRSAGVLPEGGDAHGNGAGGGAAPGSGLPGLAKLPAPQRQLSILGPGYFMLPLDEMVARSGVTGGLGGITIDGGAALGYVVYGVYGFDGDNGPTSAKIVAGAVTGQYFVAFSDYVAGTWKSAGPFTGSAEVEIPNTDAYTSPTAFTSPKGACYLAVLASAGNSASLMAVELGVQGGTLGPQPVTGLGGQGEAPAFYLHWSNSASYADPDFAGYIVQSARQFDGSFLDLTAGPIRDTFLLDAFALQNVLYRYRVCAQDASGHRSVWRSIVDGPVSGEKALPILNMHMPRGPLNGPVDVTFDLSGSVDPMAEGITTYYLSFSTGMAPMSGASPSFTVTMQPGCYVITAVVECAGPPVRSVDDQFFLVVYPRWQAAPVVVREPGAPVLPTMRRMLMASATFNAAAGRVTFCGIDVSNIGVSFWSAPAANPAAMTVTRLPVYFSPTGAGDAFDVGASTFYPYSTPDALFLARFEGSTVEQEYAPADPSTGNVAAAYDGSVVWAFYDNFDGVNTNLVCEPFGSGTGFTVVPATGGLSAIDALYNPATGTIDVVYGGAATTEWVRVNTATAAVVGSATLDAAAPAVDIDLELDPATGRPMVLYSHTAIHRFRALNALNVWTAEEQVDNAIVNFTPLDLIVDDGTRYAYFRTGPLGQAVLYKDSGGVWSPANVVSFSANSGYEVALVPQQGSPDRGLVLDMDSLRNFHLSVLHGDGTDSGDTWLLPVVEGQGFDLQTTAGTDGLHAVWRSLGTSIARHALSIDGGATWNDPGDIGLGFSDLGLAADTGGNVYFSCHHGANAELYWWDGAALNLRASFPNASAHRPFFSQPPDSPIQWYAYDNVITTLHCVSANEPAYPDAPVVMTTTPIWEGVGNTLGIDNLWFGLVGGATTADGNVCWANLGSTEAAKIYDPLLGGSLDLYNTPVTWGRTFASTTYVGTISTLPLQAVFCTRGRVINPVMYVASLIDPPEIRDIVVGKDYSLFSLEDLFTDDVRDTASCSLAYSATGLVLLSSVDGARSYFAWSHYGDWEVLPLPAAINHVSMPQLQVGLDGRWHIIYKNWLTDQMMCISTL